MSFDVSRALKKSTGRAKSDVANKLVSMFLHEVSRKACSAFGMTVSGLAPLQVGDEIITRIELGSSNKLPSEVAEVRTFSPVTGPNVDLAITTNGGIVYPDTFTFSDDTEVQAVWTIVRI